jgi:hypothetical protein
MGSELPTVLEWRSTAPPMPIWLGCGLAAASLLGIVSDHP